MAFYRIYLECFWLTVGEKGRVAGLEEQIFLIVPARS